MSKPTLWLRNPHNYIREVIEAGSTHIAWDGGFLAKRNIDAKAFAKLYFGNNIDYEMLVINQTGSWLYDQSSPEDTLGVFPTWDAFQDSVGLLEDWAANPAGESDDCDDMTIPDAYRPIRGQRHLIICHNFPSMLTVMGKRALQTVRDIQEDYPECEFYIHGLYFFVPIINMKFAHFDNEPRTLAAKKQVYLPPGKKVKVDTEIHRSAHWIKILGYSRADLEIPRNRCMFNIKAIQYAIDHANDTEATASQKNQAKDYVPNPDLPADLVILPKTRALSTRARTMEGDKVDCNTCSLTQSCKVYREGSVCTLPDSEYGELASQFQTRDTETILNGMSRLTALSVARAERGMAFEDDFGLDPEVTKLFDQAFKFAERFAKLNDPRLRATINLNRNENGSGVIPATAERIPVDGKTAAAQAIAFFEHLKIPRANITPAMVTEYLECLANGTEYQPKQLENTPVEAEVVN